MILIVGQVFFFFHLPSVFSPFRVLLPHFLLFQFARIKRYLSYTWTVSYLPFLMNFMRYSFDNSIIRIGNLMLDTGHTDMLFFITDIQSKSDHFEFINYYFALAAFTVSLSRISSYWWYKVFNSNSISSDRKHVSSLSLAASYFSNRILSCSFNSRSSVTVSVS